MPINARKLSARGFEIQIKKILLRWVLSLKSVRAILQVCRRHVSNRAKNGHSERAWRSVDGNAVGGDNENVGFDFAQTAFKRVDCAAKEVDNALRGFFLKVV